MSVPRLLLMVAALSTTALTVAAAQAQDPAGLFRAEICLNGSWETVVNAPGDAIPAVGWTSRRVPALPIASTDPPTTSVWYRQRFTLPRAWFRPGRRFLLTLGKVGHYAALHGDGRLIAEHHGQFTPFEADITSVLQPGQACEIALFVHDASGKYARPGAVLEDPREGNAYRGATDRPEQRNWVGIVGDVILSWRPAASIADVQVIPSVRTRRLEVRADTAGAGRDQAPLAIRAAVLDDARSVLELAAKPLPREVEGRAGLSLEAAWTDPVLWGPEPYGTPRLYVLRTELVAGGVVVDRRFTRFGFREVWVDGRDVLLNGKKLWMTGTYYGKLMPPRYLNDRRPQSMAIAVMQASGLNTLHGHWDDLGEPWLDCCDEMGMLVLAGYYCDGRPQIQSRADPGWEAWMGETCSEWVHAVRHHPSIVMWRPIDIGPANVMPRSRALFNSLASRVRREDATRPFVFGSEDSEIDAWAQSPLKDPRDKTQYDDGSRMVERFTGTKKPFLTKEIYTGFGDVENVSRFFRTFAEKSHALGGTGLIVQHLPLIVRSRPFAIDWLSQSGLGNRDASPTVSPGNLPNWCDPSQPTWTPSPYSDLFRTLHVKFLNRAPAASALERAAELLVTGLAADDLALLVPDDPAVSEALGVRAAEDGTAWIVPPRSGDYRLHHAGGSQRVQVPARISTRKPGYDDVERIRAARN
jgi:hypothetical protein